MHALAPTMPVDLRVLLESLGAHAEGERPRSERVLERLLDLKRCVALDHALYPQPPADEIDAEQRLLLEQAQLARLRLLDAKLLGRLRELRGQIDRRFDNALLGAHRAPDAATLHALLTDGGGLQPGGASRRRAVATRAASRYLGLFDGMADSILNELHWLHLHVHEVLQQGNAETLRLVELDRVLDGVFRTELKLSRAQLATTLGAALETRLCAECAALPDAASADLLGPWFTARGCIGLFLRDARRFCHALLDLEWSALMGLFQAAVQAEQSGQPSEQSGAPTHPAKGQS